MQTCTRICICVCTRSYFMCLRTVCCSAMASEHCGGETSVCLPFQRDKFRCAFTWKCHCTISISLLEGEPHFIHLVTFGWLGSPPDVTLVIPWHVVAGSRSSPRKSHKNMVMRSRSSWRDRLEMFVDVRHTRPWRFLKVRSHEMPNFKRTLFFQLTMPSGLAVLTIQWICSQFTARLRFLEKSENPNEFH